MVLLFCGPYLDVRDDVDSAREADTAVGVNAADVAEGNLVDDGQRLEIAL